MDGGPIVTPFQTPSVATESLPYVHRLRLSGLVLSSRLTQADEPSSRNLRFSAIMILTNSRYSFRHSHCDISTMSLPVCFCRTLLPTNNLLSCRSFGMNFSPVTFSAHNHSTSELLHSLNEWLLLSQHPGCLPPVAHPF